MYLFTFEAASRQPKRRSSVRLGRVVRVVRSLYVVTFLSNLLVLLLPITRVGQLHTNYVEKSITDVVIIILFGHGIAATASI